ncbi:NUDIX hydrolase [Devosia sp. ZB163]|uniref:NUDIX hydrolase n=1 Tax=Devosia sp. ZB163 TaxID=3025938 RepID=UPI0023629916|nr:NUDIX hydrolase [Devosia sp. ZB163]MDC9826350.1 NUDIX hydrolase [Devosia sp. ZB163]
MSTIDKGTKASPGHHRQDNRQDHRQVAALPWRLDDGGELQILLVTSRTNKKWMLPKGWPMAGVTDATAALIEAREEAGVEGVISPSPIGTYRYVRVLGENRSRPARATIYALRVVEEHATWDEMNQRERAWFRLDVAASMVFEPDLSRFLNDIAACRMMLG